jgi:CBS domain containing-hemolysin-like protein
MVELILFAISILLILACGIFVAAEFALIAVNRTAVERLAERGDSGAQHIAHALKTLSTQLSSAQVGITITNLAIGFLAEPVMAHILTPPLTAIGISEDVVPGIAVTAGLVLATALTMIFGELVPKNIAISKPLATARLVQKPLLSFTRIMKYPIHILNRSANFILERFGVKPQEELASARSADELLSLVRRSAEQGTLAKATALMLERSLSFGDLTALDVMTPRVRVQSIQADEPVTEVLKKARKSGLSRFPVYGEDLDNVLGVVHIKQAMAIPRGQRNTTAVRKIMRRPVLVPSSIQLEPLLEDLKKGGLQMAIVVDEFGAVDGIVTIEDLLEELVGEVKDEHDRSGAAIRKRADGSWLIAGLLRPDEIGEELNIYLHEEEEVETIGGLVIRQLERIPKVGDHLHLEGVDRDGNKRTVELTVERMDGYRIDRLRLKELPPEHREHGA